MFGIVNRKYDIIERQIKLQNDPRPAHLKASPHRPLQLRAFKGLAAVTAAYTVYGIFSLMTGHGKAA